jgi:hypothetical protein
MEDPGMTDNDRIVYEDWRVIAKGALIMLAIIAMVYSVIVCLASAAYGRPAKPRPPGGDVHITISTREQIIVIAVFNGVNPQATSYDKLRALMTLDQALALDEGRAWLKANPKGNPYAAPDEAKVKLLTRVEAEALVDALAIKPTKEHPIDLATGRIIVDVHDAVADALATSNAASKPKTPVAKK